MCRKTKIRQLRPLNILHNERDLKSLPFFTPGPNPGSFPILVDASQIESTWSEEEVDKCERNIAMEIQRG